MKINDTEMKNILEISDIEIKELYNVLGLEEEEGGLKYEITSYCLEIESDNEYGSFISIYPDGGMCCTRKDDNEHDYVANPGDVYKYLYSIGIDPLNLKSLTI